MKIIYVNRGVKNYRKEDHRSYIRNFGCNWFVINLFLNNCDDLSSNNSTEYVSIYVLKSDFFKNETLLKRQKHCLCLALLSFAWFCY